MFFISFQIIKRQNLADPRERTSEEERLGSTQEAVFSLGISDRVEAPNAHDLANSVSAPIIGVRVSAQDATEVCFEPELLGSFTLLASLVNAKGFDGTRNSDMNAHV